MRTTISVFYVVAALGAPFALSTCTGETAIGFSDASVANCGQGNAAVDLANDNQNCGACGVVCATGKRCAQGQCLVQNTVCDAGFADCNANSADGCEVNTVIDAHNCGKCGTVCSNGTCSDGQCHASTTTCDAGYADCDGNTANGCEVDLRTSTANCGACGMACASNRTCVAGACSTQSDICYGNFANCDGLATTGCETDISSSNSNCGTCGNICATGTTCVAGTCEVPAGLTVCGNVAVNLLTDSKNCGTCGKACDSGYTCQGTCTKADLHCSTSGFVDCNGDASDGCEANLDMSLANCGACGNICDVPNGEPLCYEGSCIFEFCYTGYASCDSSRSNGCEVDLTTDLNNCGSCGTVCNHPHSAAICKAGTCNILSCDSGFADCDADITNGCETNIATSTTNCGTCGNTCATGRQCAAGQCVS